MSRKHKHTYTVAAGRQIYKDGNPWLYINGNIDKTNSRMLYDPCEADALVYLVADLLNKGYVFNGSKGMPPFKWVKGGECSCSTCYEEKQWLKAEQDKAAREVIDKVLADEKEAKTDESKNHSQDG